MANDRQIIFDQEWLSIPLWIREVCGRPFEDGNNFEDMVNKVKNFEKTEVWRVDGRGILRVQIGSHVEYQTFLSLHYEIDQMRLLYMLRDKLKPEGPYERDELVFITVMMEKKKTQSGELYNKPDNKIATRERFFD